VSGPVKRQFLLRKVDSQKKRFSNQFAGIPNSVLEKKARIFKPSKCTMQSGSANTKVWKMKFEKGNTQFEDPLMGWFGSDDPVLTLELTFPTKEAAVTFAEENGYNYEIQEEYKEEETDQSNIRSYADNFKFKPPPKNDS